MRTSTTGTSRNSRRGFTLLELMIVLALLTVLSGIVVVNLGPTLQESRLRAGARTIVAALRYARGYAVAHRARTRVVFDTTHHGVSVQVEERGDDDTLAWRLLTTQAGRYRPLADGVTYGTVSIDAGASTTPENGAVPATAPDEEADAPGETGEASSLTYSLLGQTSAAEITIQGTSAKGMTIEVDAITGRCEFATSEATP